MSQLPTPEKTLEQPLQFQHTIDHPELAESKQRFLTSSVVLLLFLLVGIGSLWFYVINRPEEKSQQQVAETPTTTPEIVSQEESKPLYYVRDWQLWQSMNDVDTQLFSAGKAVLAFKSSPDGTYVAYTVGALQENSVGHQFVYPDTLFLLNTQTGQQTELFSIDVTTNLEYVYRLVEIAFSRDSKHVAFSTSNNVYVHSFETNTTEPLFGQTTSTQAKSSRGTLIFGYNGMSFSPTNQYLYVRRGFYEGMEPVVVSIATKAEVSIPIAEEFGGYGGYMLDWYDDHSLLAVKHVSTLGDQTSTELMQLSILDQTFKKLASVPQEYQLYGAYQMGALRLFAVVQSSNPGEDKMEIEWLAVNPQNPAGLTQIASFKKQLGMGFEGFEMIDDDTVLFQTIDHSVSAEQLYTYDKAANQLLLVKDDARLSNWR